MLNTEEILDHLREYNRRDAPEGFRLTGLFGSYARGTADLFSDIDITYTIDPARFAPDDGYARLAHLEAVKAMLGKKFHRPIDLIPTHTQNKHLHKNLEKEQILL